MSFIEQELNWLSDVISSKAEKKSKFPKPQALTADPDSHFENWIVSNKLDDADRLLLILTLAPQISPGFLDGAIAQAIKKDGDYPEFGGTRSTSSRGFLPTAQTFVYLLAGSDLNANLEAWYWLRNKSKLYKEGDVSILKTKSEEDPTQSGALKIQAGLAEEILFGESAAPAFSMEFPAKRVKTQLGWDDLVLNKYTRQQVDELKEWLEQRDKLEEWKINRRFKKGYRALFHGPPGTGKTLAATLLGKHTGTEVFWVDLSLVVSKYIGETEKNLAQLFNKAQNKNWILFFDEADSLFGKRTNVRDAHDKYANQEVSYLLQRIEEFKGLVILASNLKGNIDDAFLRRFQSVIHFPMPGAKERLKIWKTAIEETPYEIKTADLNHLAERFELTGANIINAVHFASIRILANPKAQFLAHLRKGVQREIHKEGKIE